ncbi:MAG: amino acid permease [Gammaproteobacteria bacterium]|nr:amino acid permease [Gammaproteobacteria bacterium]
MSTAIKHRKVLSLFSLAMITIGSVDSVRNLPTTALFGAALIFFFAIAALTFLVPAGLVSAELASAWPKQGGVYAWVKEAFGECFGFLAIWFQWVENIIWYPTILSFIAGTIAYLISPNLMHNRLYLVSIIIIVFWAVTWINVRGIKTSAHFAAFCTIFGLVIPMMLIILLGAIWVAMGKPLQISFGAQQLLPNLRDPNLLVSLTAVVLCYCGIEISTAHAHEVKNPQRDFPKALIFSVLFIFITMVLGGLAIAVVLPRHQISLVAGLIQAFSAFLSAYHIGWLTPFMAVFIVIGGLGGISNWVIAPIKGMVVAFRDIDFPIKQLSSQNAQGAPAVLLWLQALVVTLVTSVFLFMPSINSAYWMLTAVASQLYMVMYIMMFAAGIWLRYKHRNTIRAYKVPGGNYGMWFIATIGIIASAFTFGISFHPPGGMGITDALHYEEMIGGSLLFFSVTTIILYFYSKKSRLRRALANDK